MSTRTLEMKMKTGTTRAMTSTKTRSITIVISMIETILETGVMIAPMIPPSSTTEAVIKAKASLSKVANSPQAKVTIDNLILSTTSRAVSILSDSHQSIARTEWPALLTLQMWSLQAQTNLMSLLTNFLPAVAGLSLNLSTFIWTKRTRSRLAVTFQNSQISNKEKAKTKMTSAIKRGRISQRSV